MIEIDVICPYCFGHGVRTRGEHVPLVGDYALCAGCHQVSVFTNRRGYRRGIDLRKPYAQEKHQIARHPGLMRAS